MKPLLLALTLIFFPLKAQATLKSWWKGFCERNLIAEYPYELEENLPFYSDVWVERMVAQLAVKERWNKITPTEKRDLGLLIEELERRQVGSRMVAE